MDRPRPPAISFCHGPGLWAARRACMGESAMKPTRWLAAGLLALGALAGSAQAQNYPARPVKLVVPYAPGGPNDIVARILAQKLTEALGGQFYVENTPGAGGTIGMGAAANAPGDGHTLLVANQDLIV